jgi:hypothetical protein
MSTSEEALVLIEEIRNRIEWIYNEGTEGGYNYAHSVSNAIDEIEDWVAKHDFATERQMRALRNWNKALGGMVEEACGEA